MRNDSRGRAAVFAVGFLLFLVREPTAVHFQKTPTPSAPAAIAEWLREDDARIWRVLAEAPTLALGKEARAAVVGYLLSEIPPGELEEKLTESPSLEASTFSLLGDVLRFSSPPMTGQLQQFIARAAASRSRRIGASGDDWSPGDYEGLLAMQFVDPSRFVSDETFRERVVEILPTALDPNVPQLLKDLLLFSINNVPGIDFWISERIESTWKAVPRTSRERAISYDPSRFHFDDDYTRPIDATVYSLPSNLFDAAEAHEFLKSVREVSPRRTLVVLVDLPLREKLSGLVKDLGVHLIETHGRRYTPWPRDPFSLLRRNDDGVLVLLRPTGPTNRDEDLFMGLELIQGLPSAVDDVWGEVQWVKSLVTFHNGQVLLTPECAWVSLHSLEPRVLQMLGEEEVPVDELYRNESTWQSYLGAARRAAGEFSELYRREVKFVHPLPDKFESALEVEKIGGGAGFDLDSLLTIVKGTSEKEQALIGDVAEGTALIQNLTVDDLETLRTGFGLSPAPQLLRQELVAAQGTDRARRLRAYLDLMASWLNEKGLVVSRLPLVLVPVKLLTERTGLHHEDFLITWTNVVLENRGGRRRAEGFSSHLPLGDRQARAIFQKAGYELDLVTPLVTSIILNGGYRCASQSLRTKAQE